MQIFDRNLINIFMTFNFQEEGADFVVALTHMRWPNDVRLTQEVPDMDLVLGGHDHGYGVKEIDGELVYSIYKGDSGTL